MTALTLLLGAVGYAVQIYCDFSGYTDMAIGCGRIMGFRFPDNFKMPYSSANITEFWRRWHITLSQWFRDYLFLPLEIATRNNPSPMLRVSVQHDDYHAALRVVAWRQLDVRHLGWNPRHGTGGPQGLEHQKPARIGQQPPMVSVLVEPILTHINPGSRGREPGLFPRAIGFGRAGFSCGAHLPGRTTARG